MNAADWVDSQDWAITLRGFDAMVAVANRVNLDPEAVETQLGRPLDNSQITTVTDGVAVVPVMGVISRYANLFTRISGGTSIEILARDFRVAVDDPKVRAIILNIDSPGGTVNGTSEFAAQVYAARGAKPVVAYTGNSACSGAYWIASACSEIVANDTAQLGSIGVIGGFVQETDHGPVKKKVSSRARNKRPDYSTQEGERLAQTHVDDLEDVFVATVARYRDTTEDAVVEGFDHGNHVIASKAIAAGMADRIGSLDGLIGELSRGEWPSPAPRLAPQPQDRRAAMSVPNTPAVAAPPADNVDYKAMLAQYKAETDAKLAEAEARVQSELNARLEQAADSFVASLSSGANPVITPGEQAPIRASFLIAARDDHDRPVPNQPTARQDALRAAFGKRAPHNLLGEVTASNPTGQTAALAMDPAAPTTPAAPDPIIEVAHRYKASQANGTK